MDGTVKWYQYRKQYGFIDGADGESYFVHRTALVDVTSLREGDKVTFEPEDGPKGKLAKEVKLVEKASDYGYVPKRADNDQEAPAEDAENQESEDYSEEDSEEM